MLCLALDAPRHNENSFLSYSCSVTGIGGKHLNPQANRVRAKAERMSLTTGTICLEKGAILEGSCSLLRLEIIQRLLES